MNATERLFATDDFGRIFIYWYGSARFRGNGQLTLPNIGTCYRIKNVY